MAKTGATTAAAMAGQRRTGIVLALLAAIFFGVSHSVVVLAYQGGSNPLTVSATRFILPVLVLVVFLVIRDQPVFMRRRNGIGALALGILTAAYTIALLMALEFLPAGIAILVFHLFPIFTGLILAVLGWAPLDKRMSLLAMIALLGIALTLGVKFREYSILGLILAAAAAFGLGLMSAIASRLIAVANPLRATIYMSFGALVCLLAVVALMGGFSLPETDAAWAGFMLSHVFFAAALISYFVAIDHIGAPMSATLGNLQPLVVIAVAFVLLDQRLTILQLAGAVIVVGALAGAAMKKGKAGREKDGP